MSLTEEAGDGRLIRLEASDSWQLALRDFSASQQAGKPVILIFAAMGAPARAYKRLARWLADRGYPVATLDVRGTGESLPHPRRGVDYGVSDHLYRDWPAAIAWARAEHPGRKIVLLGHSIGGQLSGLYAGLNHGAVDALILLTTTSVWWKSSPRLGRRLGAWRMFALFSIVARLLGWFPGHRFNWGLPLGRQLVLDWAHWGFTGSYCDTERRNLDGALASVGLPVLAISFTDDKRLAPRPACEDYLRRMPCAQLTRWHLKPQEIGLDQAGHFAHLKSAPILWARIDSWICSALS